VAVAEAMRPRLTPHPLVIDVPADLPWLQISYAQIEQVLRNLLENAAHYTPASAPIEVWARAGDGVLRLEVRDRGPGVPLELRERIFDKFVRAAAAERRAEGAGLGLAICRGLVEAHGGASGSRRARAAARRLSSRCRCRRHHHQCSDRISEENPWRVCW